MGVCKTSSPLHIFSSSHLPIFTSSHLHIFTSSHLLILRSSHLLICSSSHLLIFTSSDLLIFSSAHLLIFTSSHLHIFSSSHLLIFTSSHPHILPSCPLALSFFSISLLKAGQGQCQRDGTKRNPFARNEVPSPKTELKLRFQLVRVPRNPFARNEVRSPKTAVKLRFPSRPAQPFRTKRGSIAKNCSKIAIPKSSRTTLSHETRFDPQKLQ